LTFRIAFFQILAVTTLVLGLLAPLPAFANKAMFMQATLNPTQTQQGVSVVIAGRVFDTNTLGVSNAVISIQVTNPEATSIHLAVAYSAPDGTFADSFVIPLNSPGGNYTAYLVADKPGYDTARVTLEFNYSSPDFSLQPSLTELTLRQGDVGKLTLKLVSIRGFNDLVNLTAPNPPSGVTLQFNPATVKPSGTTQVTVAVSETAAMGNFTITLLGVSGVTIRTVSFQLLITAGPIQAAYVGLPAAVAIAAIAVIIVRRRSKRSRRKAAVEELLKASEADQGYVATARVIARLEELRATKQVDESTYQKLKREYEKRLEKSK
jgi:hypothetical protein